MQHPATVVRPPSGIVFMVSASITHPLSGIVLAASICTGAQAVTSGGTLVPSNKSTPTLIG